MKYAYFPKNSCIKRTALTDDDVLLVASGEESQYTADILFEWS